MKSDEVWGWGEILLGNMRLMFRVAVCCVNMHTSMFRMALCYVNMHIPMFRMAICCVNMHISMFRMASNQGPATWPGKFLNVPDDFLRENT